MPSTPSRLSVEQLERRDTPATLYAVADSTRLIRFDSANPSVLQADLPISGLNTLEGVVGLDFRPRTGQLYSLGFKVSSPVANLRLLVIDPKTGNATQVGGTIFLPASLVGVRFSFDFIPTTDQIRVVTATGQNLRVNPTDASVTTDAQIQPATQPPPNVVAAVAYPFNNDRFRTPENAVGRVILRNTDTNAFSLGYLGYQSPPSPPATAGTVSVIGPLNTTIDPNAPMGFDIPADIGFPAEPTYAVFDADTTGGVNTGLYSVNLYTGAATRTGTVGDGTRLLYGLAVAPDNRIIAVGSGPGTESKVEVYDAFSGALKFTFNPFPGFFGGVSVAVTDVVGNNGDLTPDIVVGAGPGGGPHVKVYEGLNGAELASYFAYDVAFRGGVNVATGDVNGDGIFDIITGAGQGGGPHVKVFDWSRTKDLASFMAYDVSFTGGVRVAGGDFNADATDEIVTAAGPGGGPHVKVFSYDRTANAISQYAGATSNSFFAYDVGFRGGVWVSVGDVNGDGAMDIITGADAGGGPHVKVFSGKDNGAVLASYFAFDPTFSGGVRVAVVDTDRDGRVEVLAAPGVGLAPSVRVLNPLTGGLLRSFDVLAGANGVTVAGGLV